MNISRDSAACRRQAAFSKWIISEESDVGYCRRTDRDNDSPLILQAYAASHGELLFQSPHTVL